jgi:hypothetical protein
MSYCGNSTQIDGPAFAQRHSPSRPRDSRSLCMVGCESAGGARSLSPGDRDSIRAHCDPAENWLKGDEHEAEGCTTRSSFTCSLLPLLSCEISEDSASTSAVAYQPTSDLWSIAPQGESCVPSAADSKRGSGSCRSSQRSSGLLPRGVTPLSACLPASAMSSGYRSVMVALRSSRSSTARGAASGFPVPSTPLPLDLPLSTVGSVEDGGLVGRARRSARR